MILEGHDWVCATCGQGLTRKSTAIRHNSNLHSGTAMLVRPYDYIIGRLSGRFLPSDPSLYRRKNRNDSASPLHDNPDRIVLGPVKGEDLQERGYWNINHPFANFKSATRTPSPLHPSHKLEDVRNADTLKKSPDRMLNFKEFEILVKKHYPPDDAGQFILIAAIQAIQGGDHEIEKYLQFLRAVDRAKSHY